MRIDKFFGLAALVAVFALAVMIFVDFGLNNNGMAEKQTSEETKAVSVLNEGGTKSTEASVKALDNNLPTSSGNIVVCIDPARGGTDVGTINGNYYEKNVVLDIANKVALLLKDCNVKVVMTRTTDVAVTDEKRAATSNDSKADLCVSIRMNAFADEATVSGAETWIHVKQPKEAEKASKEILNSISKNTGIKSRGVKAGTQSSPNENYYINSKCKCTSLVLNLGFMTNQSDLKIVTEKKDEVAKAIAQGIINYFIQAGIY